MAARLGVCIFQGHHKRGNRFYRTWLFRKIYLFVKGVYILTSERINMKIFTIIFILLFFTGALFGEIYQGIMPSFNLNAVKKLFPQANFERTKAAWLQEDEALYSIDGPGISGTIMIKLGSSKDLFKRWAEKSDSVVQADTLNNPDTSKWDKLFKLKHSWHKEWSEQHWREYREYTEDSMSVDWVRWVPSLKIPLKRFFQKYGKPDSTGYSDVDLTPYKFWKRGISVYYNEKELVEWVDFSVTYEDEKKDWIMRNDNKELSEFQESFLRDKYHLPPKKHKVPSVQQSLKKK
jgi:hypothetical protein